MPQGQVPNVTGNWQIESASIYGPNGSTTSGITLYGGLVSNGQAENSSLGVTGTLTFGYLGPPTTCHQPQAISFTGTVDAARNLTLTSETLQGGGVVTVNMPLPATLSTYGTGGSISVSAGACTQASMGVTGALQEPLTGTFTGALSPGAFGTTSAAAGTGSLVLTETPVGISGVPVYELSGTFSYTLGACTGSLAVSGNHSGVAFSVNGPSTMPRTVSIAGGANSTATSLQIDQILFTAAPCSTDPSSEAVYSGTLALQ